MPEKPRQKDDIKIVDLEKELTKSEGHESRKEIQVAQPKNKIDPTQVTNDPSNVVTSKPNDEKPNEPKGTLHKTFKSYSKITVVYFSDQGSFLSILYYLSILLGPICALFCGSLLCLVPIHNELKQPFYWYEGQLCRMFAAGPMILQNIFGIEYWADFTFSNKWTSWNILGGLCLIINPIVIIAYYLTWTNLGYYPPLPMSQHLGGSSCIIAMNAVTWFRYDHLTVTYVWNEYVI